MMMVMKMSYVWDQKSDKLYEKVSKYVGPVVWSNYYRPLIDEINQLKKENNSVILAHNYQNPLIYHCVADVVGDSLWLAKEATKVKADTIIQAGVYFMAETSKIMNPTKKVLIPDREAGCSLASSITAEQVRGLRKQYPGIPIVAYVNTTAEVKAEVDICCTSANAVKVVESFDSPWVIMLPDKYLAQNVAKQTYKFIIHWDGSCEVHEKFTKQEIDAYRNEYPGIEVLSHPECPREVVESSDFSGSTDGMIKYIEKNKPKQVMLLTECSMSDNIQYLSPSTEFLRPCNFCPHMQRITMEKIRDSLKYGKDKVTVDPDIIDRARQSIQKMIDLG
jgi:quinolinate synthase